MIKARTAIIWFLGLVGSGIAGGIGGVALIQPLETIWGVPFIGGLLSGALLFMLFRPRRHTPSRYSAH